MRKMYKSITKKTLFDLATIKSKKALIEFLQNGEWRSTKQLIARSLEELKHIKGFKSVKENLLLNFKQIADHENTLRLYNAKRYYKKLKQAYLKGVK